ncbi:NUDIX hydrolase [Brevibacillus daliensis]|uniref:NUDIX hydrolase n=1 Tax=Brevibacillus daliensis TaxID=2892995 RepID=UPI001E3AB000|nr:NUDIX hydrolase [Brevibacillus daliensis]
MSLRLPISIKGVIVHHDKVLLLKNERNEWELPGGRLEENETPEECVLREIAEETALICTTTGLIDTWVYTVAKGKQVFIVTYLCHILLPDSDSLRISDEHLEGNWFSILECQRLPMPDGYKDSILRALLF